VEKKAGKTRKNSLLVTLSTISIYIFYSFNVYLFC